MKVSLFLIFIFFSFSAFPQYKSYNPQRAQYHQYKLFSGYFIDEVSDLAYVSWIRQSQSGIRRVGGKKKIKIALSSFKKSQNLAQYVFKMHRSDDDTDRYGSAIYIGENLFLTNLHTLSSTMNEKTSCNGSKFISEGSRYNMKLSCSKVLACSKKADFCLLKVKPDRYGKLKRIKKPNLILNPAHGERELITAIGNPMGYGLYASSGYGLEENHVGIKFYAPVYEGNSGGGIFNTEGDIIGLVRARSRIIGSHLSYSAAISFKTIKSILHQKIKNTDLVNRIPFKDRTLY